MTNFKYTRMKIMRITAVILLTHLVLNEEIKSASAYLGKNKEKPIKKKKNATLTSHFNTCVNLV